MQINTCKTHYQIFKRQHGTEEIKVKINNKFTKQANTTYWGIELNQKQ